MLVRRNRSEPATSDQLGHQHGHATPHYHQDSDMPEQGPVDAAHYLRPQIEAAESHRRYQQSDK